MLLVWLSALCTFIDSFLSLFLLSCLKSECLRGEDEEKTMLKTVSIFNHRKSLLLLVKELVNYWKPARQNSMRGKGSGCCCVVASILFSLHCAFLQDKTTHKWAYFFCRVRMFDLKMNCHSSGMLKYSSTLYHLNNSKQLYVEEDTRLKRAEEYSHIISSCHFCSFSVCGASQFHV